eukprot:6194650-Pleurochrysis_carterae.AAC.6
MRPLIGRSWELVPERAATYPKLLQQCFLINARLQYNLDDRCLREVKAAATRFATVPLLDICVVLGPAVQLLVLPAIRN